MIDIEKLRNKKEGFIQLCLNRMGYFLTTSWRAGRIISGNFWEKYVIESSFSLVLVNLLIKSLKIYSIAK